MTIFVAPVMGELNNVLETVPLTKLNPKSSYYPFKGSLQAVQAVRRIDKFMGLLIILEAIIVDMRIIKGQYKQNAFHLLQALVLPLQLTTGH